MLKNTKYNLQKQIIRLTKQMIVNSFDIDPTGRTEYEEKLIHSIARLEAIERGTSYEIELVRLYDKMCRSMLAQAEELDVSTK